ncbi:MAG: PaaI family thioesterase [Campylobacterales bacterium]|nr:PaaI family thioesterase [Campylobacterales bacterium]
MADERGKERKKSKEEVPSEEEVVVLLKTHEKIDQSLCGDVDILKRGYAKIILDTNESMRADEVGLVHGGFIFGAADFAAMAAVNERNVVLAAASCQFLAPVRVGDAVTFEAFERQKEGRKRSVYVVGTVLEIKVFEGEFKTVVTDNHVLNLTLVENADSAASGKKV